jgi:hypothetical protein
MFQFLKSKPKEVKLVNEPFHFESKEFPKHLSVTPTTHERRIVFKNRDQEGHCIAIISVNPAHVIVDVFDISTGIYMLVTNETITRLSRQNLQLLGKDGKPTNSYRQEIVNDILHSKIETNDFDEIKNAWSILHPNEVFEGFILRDKYLKEMEAKKIEELKRREEQLRAEILKKEEELNAAIKPKSDPSSDLYPGVPETQMEIPTCPPPVEDAPTEEPGIHKEEPPKEEGSNEESSNLKIV